MNNARRKEIEKLVERINEVAGTLSDIMCDLETVKSEEQEYNDNIPDNLRESDRCSTSDSAIENLEDASNAFSDCIEILQDSIVCSLESAAE